LETTEVDTAGSIVMANHYVNADAKGEPDDNDFDPLARYERGVMTFLFILAAALSALIIWLGIIFLR
jgi:hypothetical protein